MRKSLFLTIGVVIICVLSVFLATYFFMSSAKNHEIDELKEEHVNEITSLLSDINDLNNQIESLIEKDEFEGTWLNSNISGTDDFEQILIFNEDKTAIGITYKINQPEFLNQMDSRLWTGYYVDNNILYLNYQNQTRNINITTTYEYSITGSGNLKLIDPDNGKYTTYQNVWIY